MSDAFIERLARAAYTIDQSSVFDDEHPQTLTWETDTNQEAYRIIVRTVLHEARSATNEMDIAGLNALRRTPTGIWQAMIDKALES